MEDLKNCVFIVGFSFTVGFILYYFIQLILFIRDKRTNRNQIIKKYQIPKIKISSINELKTKTNKKINTNSYKQAVKYYRKMLKR